MSYIDDHASEMNEALIQETAKRKAMTQTKLREFVEKSKELLIYSEQSESALVRKDSKQAVIERIPALLATLERLVSALGQVRYTWKLDNSIAGPADWTLAISMVEKALAIDPEESV